MDFSEWDKFFLNNPTEEELDYEYSDDESTDVTDGEVEDTDDISEVKIKFEDPSKLTTQIKLRREFPIPESTFAQKRYKNSEIKQTWISNVHKDGLLRRWRIRASDLIFNISKKEENIKPKHHKRPYRKRTTVTAPPVEPNENVDDFSITFNNDLCKVPTFEPTVYFSTQSFLEHLEEMKEKKN